MNLVTYSKEFFYAMRAPSNWRSRWALLTTTAGFHAKNFATGRKDGGGHHLAEPIKLNMKIGRCQRTISVRPFTADIYILYEALAFQVYKTSDTAIDPKTVKTVIDCGANIGLTALFFAEQYPNARIFCIEPDPRNFVLLLENTLCEPRITSIQAAIVGQKGGTVFLTQDQPAWGNRTSVENTVDGSIEVQGITMEDLFAGYDLRVIDILKVDIEGGEEAMFASPGFLSQVRFVAIELHGDYTIDRFQKDIGPMKFVARRPGDCRDTHIVTAQPQ